MKKINKTKYENTMAKNSQLDDDVENGVEEN